MCPSLQGKIALVTGAGQGIGHAAALAFGDAGASVVVTDIDIRKAETTRAALAAKGVSSWAYSLDVADNAAVERVAHAVSRDVGDIDFLINNAGVLRACGLDDDSSESRWHETLNVNVTGGFNMIRAFQPALRRTKGAIVNVSSIFGFLGGPNLAAYCASKGAVIQLTRGLANELAPAGIRVNAIAPGVITTPLSDPVISDTDRLTRVVNRIPLRRLGSAAETAGPIVFLCSKQASYITGVVLPVDGGYLVG